MIKHLTRDFPVDPCNRGRDRGIHGAVEVDETYMGGKMKSMHSKQRREARQKSDYGKTIVAGARARDRATGVVRALAKVIDDVLFS